MPRLGITVTKKVGSAVVRNRAKRLIRETYRRMPDLLPRGVDMVVVVRRPLDELKRGDVMEEWSKVAGLLTRRARKVRAEGEGGAT